MHLAARATPKGRARLPLGPILASLLLTLSGCTSIANSLANTILSNVAAPVDDEYPPTAVSMPPSTDVVAEIGGKGFGLDCSLPWYANAVFPRTATQADISLQVREACVFHDYCYRHGNATYGYSQADCDYMLQEHAARLCRQVYGDSIEVCQTDAKKVLLGVWLGGASSFHPTRDASAATSTHFEFDPLPLETQQFTVARVVAANAESSCGTRKKLYYFVVRPSGTSVTEVAWDRGSDGSCLPSTRKRSLPGDPRFRNAPPTVVRDAGGEDWLVWWRRKEVSNTNAQILAIAPSRLDLDDWPAQFLPEAATDRTGAVVRADVDPLINFGNQVPIVTPGRLVFGGVSSQLPCDPAGRAKLSWIQTHLGTTTGLNIRSCHPITSPAASAKQDFYRHIATPPLFMEGSDDQPVEVVWQSRGDGSAATNYEKKTTIFVAPAPQEGADDAPEPLSPRPYETWLPEHLEPFVVIRASGDAAARLLTIEGGTKARELRLGDPPSTNVLELEDVAIRAPLDLTWMSRPPVLLRPKVRDDGARLIFSRFSPPDASSPEPRFELRMIQRGRDGWKDKGGSTCRFPMSTTPDSPSVCGNAGVANRLKDRLGSAQAIVADVTADGTSDLVITSEDDSRASILLIGNETDGSFEVRVDEQYVCPGWVACEPSAPTSTPIPNTEAPRGTPTMGVTS